MCPVPLKQKKEDACSNSNYGRTHLTSTIYNLYIWYILFWRGFKIYILKLCVTVMASNFFEANVPSTRARAMSPFIIIIFYCWDLVETQ